MVELELGFVLRVPREAVGVQEESEPGFGEVLGRDVESVQLVDVPHVHLGSVDLVLVEILQKNHENLDLNNETEV